MEVTSLFAGAGLSCCSRRRARVAGLARAVAVTMSSCGRWFLVLLVAPAGPRRAYASGAPRRRRSAVRYSSLSLIREAVAALVADPPAPAVRAVPLGHRSLVVALARPVAIVRGARPARRRSSSRSTSRAACAPPTSRRTASMAAEAAASAFIERQGATHPDRDRRVRRLRRDRPGADDRPEVLLDVDREPGDRAADRGRQRDPRVDRRDRRDRPERRASEPRTTRPGVRTEPVPKGAYAPAIIVLLTDGASNAGPEPVEAAPAGGRRGASASTRSGSGRRTRATEPALRAAVHRARTGRHGAGLRRVRRRRRRRWRRRVPARHRRGHAARPSRRRPAASTTRPRAPTSSTRSSPSCRRTSSPSTR